MRTFSQLSVLPDFLSSVSTERLKTHSDHGKLELATSSSLLLYTVSIALAVLFFWGGKVL